MRYRREDIIDAAIAAVDASGVGISTAAIAKAAGVSNGTLFNHFPTKAALLDSMYIELKTELAGVIGLPVLSDSLREDLAQMWHRWVEWATNFPERARVVRLLHEANVVSPVAVAVGATPFMPVQERFEQAIASGELVDLPVEFLTSAVQQHIELTARFVLTDVQRDRAFDSLWASLTV